MLNVSDLREELDDLSADDARDQEDQERFLFLSVILNAFSDYVRREAEDDVPARWLPYIDWESYERDARSDYTEIEVDGETYLYIA